MKKYNPFTLSKNKNVNVVSGVTRGSSYSMEILVQLALLTVYGKQIFF